MKTSIRMVLAQFEVAPGNPQLNTARMIALIEKAKSDNADIIIFPEMAVPGRFIGDMWEERSFLRECEECGRHIIESTHGIVAAFGNVAVDWRLTDGKDLPRKYNAFFVAEDGIPVERTRCARPYTIGTNPRRASPLGDRRRFCDSREFAAQLGCQITDILAPYHTKRAGCIGALLGEDDANEDEACEPARILANKGAKIILIASCAPFVRGDCARRDKAYASIARKTGIPLVSVQAAGVQDMGKNITVCAGSSAIFAPGGGRIDVAKRFDAASFLFDLPLDQTYFDGQKATPPRQDDTRTVIEALRKGITALTKRLGITRVVVGVSGGIDSAVAAALYASAMPPHDILLLSMPGAFTSNTTHRLARELADRLQTRFAEIPITESVELTKREFASLVVSGHEDADVLPLSDFAFENVQARDRGSRLLSAAAAAFGGVISCNANKSELTVGYGTLYGDIIGWLACLGDLWKGEVYEAGRCLNAEVFGREVIPEEIFNIKPSAELSMNQSIEKGLGDPFCYPYHDRLFRSWIEDRERATPEEILAWYEEGVLEQKIGYEGKISDIFSSAQDFISDLERWWGLHRGLAVAKRIQSPPILTVSPRAYGVRFRESQVGAHYTAEYFKRKESILSAKRAH